MTHTDSATSRTTFGFWIYIMTDCILFATFFAAYAVLHNNTNGGPGAKELFSLPFALAETLILLTSSFTCGLSLLAAYRDKKTSVLFLALVTAALGASFLALELTEFSHLISDGHSYKTSAFLTSFFSLVGLHGLHITCGLIWAVVLMGQIFQRGLTTATIRRYICFSLFWHFLDLVWIFIFTIVYLMGAL